MRPSGVGHLVKSVLVRSGTGLRPLLSVKVQALRARPILGVRCLLLLSEAWLGRARHYFLLLLSLSFVRISGCGCATNFELCGHGALIPAFAHESGLLQWLQW